MVVSGIRDLINGALSKPLKDSYHVLESRDKGQRLLENHLKYKSVLALSHWIRCRYHMDLKWEFMRTPYTTYLEGNFGIEIVAIPLDCRTKQEKWPLRKKRETYFMHLLRSIRERENALNVHSHNFSGYVKIHAYHFLELYPRCKTLWRLFTTACNAGTKMPQWCMRIRAALTWLCS